MSWGPLIHGHAPPGLVRALAAAAKNGTSYGAPSPLEHQLAERVRELVPSMELVRLVSSGTEAAMSAVRVARAFTGRDKMREVRGLLSRPRGRVPGEGRLRRHDARHAHEPRRARARGRRHAAGALQRSGVGGRASCASIAAQIAAIIVEPIAGNMGVVPPADGFLAGAARPLHGARHRADLRRGDLRLPRGGRRRAGPLRRAAGPDVPGQDHRRRAAGGRLRRPRRHHGPGGAGGPGVSGGHAVGQPAGDDGRPVGARPADAEALCDAGRARPAAGRRDWRRPRARPRCRCR